MIRELKDEQSYTATMLIISALALVFGIAFVFVGELFLPLASAFLALLFVLERPKSRYLSYLAAALPIIIAFLSKGIFGIISLEVVFLALVIALTYRFNGTKAECAAYSTLLVASFAALSLYFGGAKAIGSFDINAVFDYYSNVLTAFKLRILDVINQYVISRGADASEIFTLTDATELAEQLKMQIVSLLAIVSFILVGITLKLFNYAMLRVSKRGILKRFAHFLPSNIVSYVYVISVILSIFSSSQTIADAVILNIANILSVVFAYLGFQYATTIASASGRRRLAVSLIIIGFLMIPAVALRLLSFVGVWAAVGINNAMNGKLPPSFDR